MKANKTTIKAALQVAKLAKYPSAASRRIQKEDEWKEQQKTIIATLKGLMK